MNSSLKWENRFFEGSQTDVGTAEIVIRGRVIGGVTDGLLECRYRSSVLRNIGIDDAQLIVGFGIRGESLIAFSSAVTAFSD